MQNFTSPEILGIKQETENGAQPNRDLGEHPLGTTLGAILAASTAGATIWLIAGPAAAFVGTVFGAVAGGIGGKAVAELIEPTMAEDFNRDTYITRLHQGTRHVESSEKDRSPSDLIAKELDEESPAELKQVPREVWEHLNQSNKELIRGEEEWVDS